MKYIIDNKRMTGFTNAEEAAVGLTAVVPFSLEVTVPTDDGAKVKCAAPRCLPDEMAANLDGGRTSSKAKEPTSAPGPTGRRVCACTASSSPAKTRHRRSSAPARSCACSQAPR